MKTLGFIIGFSFAIGMALVIFMVMLKKSNTDGSMKTKFDERQLMVRGQGYKYSFWTLVVLLTASIMLRAFEVELPIKDGVYLFLLILFSVLEHTVYCIFNDGYFGINNEPKKYYISFFLIGIGNLVIGILNSIGGRLIDNGKLDIPAMNLVCGMMFVIVGISVFIKNKIDPDSDDSDDEDDYEEGGV